MKTKRTWFYKPWPEKKKHVDGYFFGPQNRNKYRAN